MKKSSRWKSRRKFRRQFADSPCAGQDNDIQTCKKINGTGSMQNKKPQVNKRVWVDDKLDEIRFRLEQIPQ